ncbi:MAG: hypothetical protein ACI867_001432 [Glaciecola sp.]|jgi:uncharacterized protein (DUF1499 family)
MNNGISKWVISLGLVAMIVIGAGQLWARTAREPDDIGLLDERLRPCVSFENCVTSDGAAGEGNIDPLKCGILLGQPLFQAVRDALLTLPRTGVVTETDTYLHAVVRSAFFGFQDDVELRLAGNNESVHIRSESRLGQGDLGVNAARVEDLRATLTATC